jgi:hypothetical protein
VGQVALIVAIIKVTKVTVLGALNNPANPTKTRPGSYYHWFITTRSSSTTAWLSDVRQLPASTVTGTARTQVSMSFVCGGSHAPLLDRNGRLISESSRSRAAS